MPVIASDPSAVAPRAKAEATKQSSFACRAAVLDYAAGAPMMPAPMDDNFTPIYSITAALDLGCVVNGERDQFYPK